MSPPCSDNRYEEQDRSRSVEPAERENHNFGTSPENTGKNPPASLLERVVYWCLGFIMLGLGVIGAVLPIMPTTIFIILAAWFFARSSPKLEARILRDPVFGPLVIKWRERGAIPRRAKIFAVSGMVLGYGMFFWGAQPGWLLGVAVALFMLGSALYVVSRPEA